MAVYRFYDPGMKDGMDSVAKVMDSIGQFERQRQDAQLSSNLMRIASEPAGSPEERMQKVYSAVADFQPQYSGGLGGVMQKAGNFFAPQSQMPQRMGGMAVDDLLQQINRERDTADYGRKQEIATSQVGPRAMAAVPAREAIILADEESKMRMLPKETAAKKETYKAYNDAIADRSVKAKNATEAKFKDDVVGFTAEVEKMLSNPSVSVFAVWDRARSMMQPDTYKAVSEPYFNLDLRDAIGDPDKLLALIKKWPDREKTINSLMETAAQAQMMTDL